MPVFAQTSATPLVPSSGLPCPPISSRSPLAAIACPKATEALASARSVWIDFHVVASRWKTNTAPAEVTGRSSVNSAPTASRSPLKDRPLPKRSASVGRGNKAWLVQPVLEAHP